MFFATAGILAQAQAGAGGWIDMYYQWILPASAPVMFFFAFLIQSVDPIMTTERDATAYAHLLSVEEKREALDVKQLDLNHRHDIRKLKAHVHKQKLTALWKESMSQRTKFTLKRAMRLPMPKLLSQIGVNTDEVGYKGRFNGLSMPSIFSAPKLLQHKEEAVTSTPEKEANPKSSAGYAASRSASAQRGLTCVQRAARS